VSLLGWCLTGSELVGSVYIGLSVPKFTYGLLEVARAMMRTPSADS